MTPALIGKAIDLVGGNIVGKFFGNKEARESNQHDENMGLLDQMEAEAAAQNRGTRTWWDSFIDGLNRLQRPAGYFCTIALVVWVGTKPIEAAAAMAGFNAMPEWLAYAIMSILLSPFITRPFEKGMFKSKVTAESVAAMAETQAKILALKEEQIEEQKKAPDPYEQVQGRMKEADFKSAMADNSKPLSLDAIVEWNRRRGNG